MKASFALTSPSFTQQTIGTLSASNVTVLPFTRPGQHVVTIFGDNVY